MILFLQFACLILFGYGFISARGKRRGPAYKGYLIVGASTLAEGVLLIMNDAFIGSSDAIFSAVLLIAVGMITCAFAWSMLYESSEGPDEFGTGVYILTMCLYAVGILFLWRVPAIGISLENIPAMIMLAAYGLTLCALAIRGQHELSSRN